LRALQKVVLPQPLGPVRRMNSPGSMLRFTSLRAGLEAWGYVYERPRVSMIVKPFTL
jgi:hypothetical protein